MIVVIGSGVIGVTTAWYLAHAGKAVTVLDAHSAAAGGCSHGNAGVIAVGHAESWAKPQAIGQLGRALMGRDPAVRVSRFMDPALWRWGLSFLANCTASASHRNTDRLLRLSRYGRETLRALEAETGLQFFSGHDGAYYLYEDKAAFDQRVAHLTGDAAAAFSPKTPAELAAIDPAIARFQHKLAGGLLSSVDSKGDCRVFTRELAALAERRFGVTFQYGCRVTGFDRKADRVIAVMTDNGRIACEGVVLATGSDTPALARQLGVRPLIYPVKGYSASFPILDPSRVPLRPYVDETHLVGVTRLGDILRVAATAEFAGHDRTPSDERRQFINAYVREHFGDAVDVDRGEHWAGLRPTTPSGAPYLGRIATTRNAWINAGHGQLGWTMSAGAARILADRITGGTAQLQDVAQTARWLA